MTAENIGELVGNLNEILSSSTSAQDQSERNVQVVEKVFVGAKELAENVSYTEEVSMNTSMPLF